MLQILLPLLLSFQVSAAPNSNYQIVLNQLKKISQENPTTTEWIEIGKSDSGQMISGLKIGHGPTADLVVATHHGNEYGSTAVAMATAEAFAKNPLSDHSVYVIPVLNISGYNTRNRYERTPGGNIDPNRDYPGPCVQTKSFQSKATKALADFVSQKKIVSSATLHTYFPAVLYPWGVSTFDTFTPYDSLFTNLTKAATVESRYQIGNSKDVLYAADGAFEDYAYWKHGIWYLVFVI